MAMNPSEHDEFVAIMTDPDMDLSDRMRILAWVHRLLRDALWQLR
jgi:hypothetical protein